MRKEFNKRIRNVSIREMNRIIKHADQYSNIILGVSYEDRITLPEYKNCSLAVYSYLKEHEVKIEFTTKYGTKDFQPCTYICRLDGEIDADVRGVDAYRVLRKHYKEVKVKDIPEIKEVMPKNERDGYLYSAGPEVGYDEAFDNTRHEVFIYDINSAYATQMMDKIPDISSFRFYDEVKEDECGFLLQEGLPLVPVGYQADLVCKLIESPYKEFARTWYDKKKNGDKETRAFAKAILNLAVGYLQRTNPFIRAWIVHGCNERIINLLDENSCMWNTDAIYSVVPRFDLIIGNEIGEWKYEYYKEFAQKGNNYQKDWEQPHYRGINRKWFNDKFDLLVDTLPTREMNIYYLKGKRIYKKKENNNV